MTVGMDVPVIMGVAMGRVWNHQRMLYYNITGVHILAGLGLVLTSKRICSQLLKPHVRARTPTCYAR